MTAEDRAGPANRGTSVAEARANSREFGTVARQRVDKVRPPAPDEGKDPDWKPSPKAAEVLGVRGRQREKG